MAVYFRSYGKESLSDQRLFDRADKERRQRQAKAEMKACSLCFPIREKRAITPKRRRAKSIV